MKLINLLKYMDVMTKIRIFIDDDPDEVSFEGYIMDIPYHLLECKLYKRDEEGDDWEGIRAYKDDNVAGIVIYLKG